eukprot:scaffold22_cov401-Pavlova_lutheri.AAC.5
MGRWRGGSRGCSTWIPESVTHALTHSVHIVGGISSKLSHAHDEASTDTAWFSGTTSSSAVENILPQRDPTPLFSIHTDQPAQGNPHSNEDQLVRVLHTMFPVFPRRTASEYGDGANDPTGIGGTGEQCFPGCPSITHPP